MTRAGGREGPPARLTASARSVIAAQTGLRKSTGRPGSETSTAPTRVNAFPEKSVSSPPAFEPPRACQEESREGRGRRPTRSRAPPHPRQQDEKCRRTANATVKNARRSSSTRVWEASPMSHGSSSPGRLCRQTKATAKTSVRANRRMLRRRAFEPGYATNRPASTARGAASAASLTV